MSYILHQINNYLKNEIFFIELSDMQPTTLQDRLGPGIFLYINCSFNQRIYHHFLYLIMNNFTYLVVNALFMLIIECMNH